MKDQGIGEAIRAGRGFGARGRDISKPSVRDWSHVIAEGGRSLKSAFGVRPAIRSTEFGLEHTYNSNEADAAPVGHTKQSALPSVLRRSDAGRLRSRIPFRRRPRALPTDALAPRL